MSDARIEAIRQALKEVAANNRVSCKQALALAENLDADPKQIRSTADEMDLKIVACQLGCF